MMQMTKISEINVKDENLIEIDLTEDLIYYYKKYLIENNIEDVDYKINQLVNDNNDIDDLFNKFVLGILEESLKETKWDII